MKKKFINKLSSNDVINDFFLVSEKKILQTKSGKNYLFLTIKDKTGSIDAKKWNIEDKIFEEINSGDIVFINGRVEEFNNNLQIIVEEVEKLEFSERYLEFLIPQTNKNINQLLIKLENFYNKIESTFIKKLIKKSLFNENFFEKFKLAPGASNFHHAYRGGLLEHTVAVTEIAMSLGNIYNVQNMDILIAGSLLHDIGKVEEYDPVTFKRTDIGKLLGHIALGYNYIDRKINEIKNFPVNFANAIKHIILSHHGEFEWGSPVQPSFIEAIIVHFADNMDSKIQPVVANINSEDGWKYLKSLRRKFVDLEFFKNGIEDSELEENKRKSKINTLF